jgi:hypothetical protein
LQEVLGPCVRGDFINLPKSMLMVTGPLPRLSGAGIRDVLYFSTAPGSYVLAVSATKGGSASLL